MSDSNDASADPAASPEQGSAPEDMRAKFREALERKRTNHLDNAADSAKRDGSSVRGEQGRTGGGRMFRRKSGG